MRIALYYPWIYLTSGAERTILRLTEHSRHEWVLFTNRFEPENTFPGFSKCRVVELPRVSVDRTLADTARSCLRIARQRLPMEEFDALLVFCEGLGDLILFRNHETPALNICLTPLRIAFDEVYQQRLMESMPPFKRLAVKTGSALFRIVDRLAWRHYGDVFCISNEVRRRVVAGGLARENDLRILLPCLGFHPESPRPEYQPFFLLPGRIMWTKNIELGIEAFRRFRAISPQAARFRLVIAGIVDQKSQSYFESLQSMAGGPDSGIEFHVYPSDEALAELYRTCYATLFTAFNEDYGIVPLEGMAYAKTVVAVDRGGPRDTIEHGVQGFLEQPDPACFARRMAELADSEELARSLGAAGLDHSRKFNWNDFASTVDDAIESRVLAKRNSTKPISAPSAKLLDQAAASRTLTGGTNNYET